LLLPIAATGIHVETEEVSERAKKTMSWLERDKAQAGGGHRSCKCRRA
jgi:hypothetical protein